MDSNHPLIISTRSGYPFAKGIVACLEEMHKKHDKGDTPNFWLNTAWYDFANREGKSGIETSIQDRNVYVVSDCSSQATPIPKELP